ncbi:MAG: Ig-like domain-containing protein [Actinomycetota bacterium]|nr:Ig-like domain-containing protein [Actinomycetota bacterium]
MERVRKLTVVVLISAMAFTSTPAFAWKPVTHYHINKQANKDLNVMYWDIYCDNGTGPDMFGLPPSYGRVEDYVHSPDEFRKKEDDQIKYPYRNSPNFAYIMLKARGLNSPTSRYYASGLGWGGHIAADWVAHNEKLFPIPLSLTSKEAYFHARGEALYDYYVYLTKGSIDTSFKFYPKQIHKALVDYEMIKLHEEDLKDGVVDYEDSYLKNTVLDAAMKEWEIRARCRTWAGTVATLQAGYWLSKQKAIVKALIEGRDSSFYLNQFINDMRKRGADENISESCRRVRDWALKPTTRNKIPHEEISAIVYPFSIPSSSLSLSLPLLGKSPFLALPFIGHLNLLWARPAWAYEVTSSENEEVLNRIDSEVYLFWQDVAEQAEAAGILSTQEQMVLTEDGEEEHIITSTITNDERFEEVVKDVVEQHVQNPASDFGKQFAIFQRNLLINQITDIDKLMDMTAPTISNLTPGDNSFTNDQTPLISAHVKDDPDGIGVDEKTITLKLSGENLACEYVTETGLVKATPPSPLPDGEYEINLGVSDKAGNEAERTWKFTVDTVPPELTCNVLNKIINVKKSTVAAIEVASNEPITFRAEIFRVKDKQTGNKGERIYTYTGENLTQEFTFFWDGRDNEGNLVPNGVYTVKITATDRATNEASFEVHVNVNNEAGK